MTDLLSGLGKFGLDNLKDRKIYEKQEEAKTDDKEKESEPVYQEEEFLFDKTRDCPVCSRKFAERTVRTGRARLLGVDRDLRPKYKQLDVGKYDVISCPMCGYTALSRYFGPLPPIQAKLIRENIAKTFVPQTEKLSLYSYEVAFERYQLCLVNAIVKRAKDSEKAYICLKTGWLLRGMAENLDQSSPGYEKQLQEISEKERSYLESAYEGFISARATEGYPMCGMDESTIDYLLASLGITLEQYDVAAKLVSGILISREANNRMKDKARDLKEVLLRERKEKGKKE